MNAKDFINTLKDDQIDYVNNFLEDVPEHLQSNLDVLREIYKLNSFIYGLAKHLYETCVHVLDDKELAILIARKSYLQDFKFLSDRLRVDKDVIHALLDNENEINKYNECLAHYDWMPKTGWWKDYMNDDFMDMYTKDHIDRDDWMDKIYGPCNCCMAPVLVTMIPRSIWTMDMVLKSIENTCWTFIHLSNELKNDHDFIKKAFNVNPYILDFIVETNTDLYLELDTPDRPSNHEFLKVNVDDILQKRKIKQTKSARF